MHLIKKKDHKNLNQIVGFSVRRLIKKILRVLTASFPRAILLSCWSVLARMTHYNTLINNSNYTLLANSLGLF